MITRIGDYEVRFEIGRGGFGRVYQAFDPRVERLVAIKILNAEADANLVSRFRSEASAAGNLHHRNIVTVYGYGEDDGHHYIVMEYLDGQTLQDLIHKANTLTLLDRVEIMSQIADGLLCAHQNGVVHRDVKPGNIMVMANETVKIMDFGIARVLRDGSARLTQSGFLVGTIAYMAPEQFAGGTEVDALCDIWAYGVIYYELLTGLNPFWATDPGAVMYQITSRAPDPIRARCPECPPALERVVKRLLSTDRETRYQSLEDVQFDVAPLLQQLQRNQASALLAEATGLAHQQRLEEATALTRKILDLDPSNAEARQLRETIQEEMRRRTLRPRVAALMRQAETEAARRNFSYALRAVESALRLTPADSAVRQYHASLRAGIERMEEASRLLGKALAESEAADLDAAFQTVTAALKADPEHPEARALLDQIRAGIEERDRAERLHHDLNQAEVLLDLSALHEAANLLDRLAAEHPDLPEVLALVERLQTNRKEHERSQRIQAELAACARQIKEEGPAVAIARLEALELEFPGEFLVLLTEAREEQGRQQRDRTCQELRQQAWERASAQEFDAALEILNQGLLTYPGQAGLIEVLEAIASAKSGHERALRLEGELQRCRQMRLEGRLDETASLVETLGKRFGESTSLATERSETAAAITNRVRARTIEEAVQQANVNLETGDADSAFEIIWKALRSVGKDTRLDDLLVRATAAQKKIERRRDIEARMSRALQHEAASEFEAAIELLAKGLELHGPVAEMEEAAARIGKLKNIADYKRLIEQFIRGHRWMEARETVGPASASHPEEDFAWREMEQRIWAGEIQEEIENALASRDLDRAAAKLAEARLSPTPLPAADALDAQLQEIQFRQQTFDRAYSLTAQGDHEAAEAALLELIQRGPSDGEANTLLKTVRERREQQEREARRAAKERAEREANLARGLTEARESMTKGDLRAATRRYQALVKQFPEDPDVQRESTAAEQAREARKREQAREEARKKAQKLVGDRKFDDAIELLRPLLQEAHGDRELQDCWRAAMEGKGRRADWLEVYETLTDLEDLYKKGKARAVYHRARKLLEQVEEPRARELFMWAESMLPQERTSGLLDRIKQMSRQQILVGSAILALLVIALLAVFFGR